MAVAEGVPPMVVEADPKIRLNDPGRSRPLVRVNPGALFTVRSLPSVTVPEVVLFKVIDPIFWNPEANFNVPRAPVPVMLNTEVDPLGAFPARVPVPAPV
jgi:hypothetical protein